MSKEADQALVMLATIAGCLETLRQTHSFARVDIKEAIDEAFDASEQAIIHWPGMTNKRWVAGRREEFQRFILATRDRGFSSCTLAAMCERLVTDLQLLGTVGRKRALLAPLVVPLKTIHDFCDPQGLNFPAYEKSDFLLDELYRLLEWK